MASTKETEFEWHKNSTILKQHGTMNRRKPQDRNKNIISFPHGQKKTKIHSKTHKNIEGETPANEQLLKNNKTEN